MLVNHPQINPANKSLLKMPQLLYIFLTGTFSYFRSVEQSLQSEFDSQLPPASMPSILLRILQAQIAQADEEHNKAIAIQT